MIKTGVNLRHGKNVMCVDLRIWSTFLHQIFIPIFYTKLVLFYSNLKKKFQKSVFKIWCKDINFQKVFPKFGVKTLIKKKCFQNLVLKHELKKSVLEFGVKTPIFKKCF